MKKLMVSLLSLALIAAACTKKMAPATTGTETTPMKSPDSDKEKSGEAEKTTEPTKPVESSIPALPPAKPMSSLPNKPSEEESGKNVYSTKCGTCHALKNTGNYTFNQWEVILKKMVPNAKLSADEESQVVAYIKGNSKH